MPAAARFSAAFTAALLTLAIGAASAFAHASLVRSQPGDGRTLERSPRSFVLTFDEAIDTEFVQLRVTDAAGRRLDRGAAHHPGGREELVAVRLRPGLEGRVVASYRVISEDGHPVGKQTSFRVRPPAPAPEDQEEAQPPAAGDGGAMSPPAAMPEPTGEHLESLTGPVTDTAFAVARGFGYLALAVALGGLLFMLVVWLPSLSQHAGAGADWRAASSAFLGRFRWIVLGAVAIGIAATAVAIVLEAATAAGVSFWAALDADRLEAISDTRVVEAWSLRLVVWLLLGALVVAVLRPRRAPVLRRAAVGAEGSALGRGPSFAQELLLVAAAFALALTVGMAGHSWSESPRALLVGVDIVHVLSMSAWIGGLVMLLVALAVTRRALAGDSRGPLLATVVGSFSRIAVMAVALLVTTGTIQAVALVGSPAAFVETAYGRLVLAKIMLLVALLALGAYNQRRSLPRLRRVAAGGEDPGRTAAILRRAVATEVALVLVVLGVTSVLVATQPASG